MKMTRKFDHSQPGMWTNFYVDVYGKNQYFLIKALLHFLPTCDKSHKIDKRLRFFMLDPIFCNNGEICIETLVFDTFSNVGDFEKRFIDENDFKEVFLDLLKIFNDNAKTKHKHFIDSINDVCLTNHYFTEDEIRCTLSFLICQDKEFLKKDFSEETIKILGEPYDPFLETLVKMQAKKMDDAQDSMAKAEAFEEFYKILK